MIHKRHKEIDAILFYSQKREFDEFTEEDGDIVRIGDWGYMTMQDYEAVFTSDRERHEYQAVENLQDYKNTAKNCEMVSKLSDNELDDLLEALNDWDDCPIYYTTAE